MDFPIQLDRDIIFFDLESTGDNPYTDRIIEISAVKIKTNGESEIKTRRINPTIPINPAATAVHGIKDEDVANEPTFKDMSAGIYKFFNGCDLAGYNIIRFDIPMLIEEFKRAGINSFSIQDKRIIDPYEIFVQMEPRTLSAAVKFYCGKDMVDAHSAEADVLATIEVFKGQLLKYPQLPKTVEEINSMFRRDKLLQQENKVDNDCKFIWSNNEVVFNFGPKKGMSLKEIAIKDPGFLQWMTRASFSEDTKQIAKNALEGKFPEKKNEKQN